MKKIPAFLLCLIFVLSLFCTTGYAAAKSTNANLKYLKTSTSKCTLSPAYNKNVQEYNVVMPADRSYFYVKAKSESKYAKVSVQVKKGASVKKTNKVSLKKGQTATVYVTVTAQAGNKKIYTINVKRLYGKWKLYWRDEFSGTTLDETKWSTEGVQDPSNNQHHYYKPENVSVSGGYLHLTARKEQFGGKEYTSGWVQTLNKMNFRYGKFEARIKIPKGAGMFPAFWLWQVNKNAKYQEVDIMEHTSLHTNRMYSVHHYTRNGKHERTFGYLNTKTPYEFHKFTLVWNDKELRTYMDGKRLYTHNKYIPKEDMYIILNLAIGGWSGKTNSKTVFPNEMLVDYVRVYQYY